MPKYNVGLYVNTAFIQPNKSVEHLSEKLQQCLITS